MRKFRIIKNYSKFFLDGEIVSIGMDDDGRNQIYHEDGKTFSAYERYSVQDCINRLNEICDFEEVKEVTPIEKIMEHFGVEEGEEFSITGRSFNPYRFENGKLMNCRNVSLYTTLASLIYGEETIEKILKKSEKDLAIERAEKKLAEAQAELEKAKRIK